MINSGEDVIIKLQIRQCIQHQIFTCTGFEAGKESHKKPVAVQATGYIKQKLNNINRELIR
jgi:hypothetical protein